VQPPVPHPFYLLVDGHWPDGSALWLILYAGIPTSALSPWLWMQGIALLGASRTAIFMNLLPVMTAALAISWLGERLTSYHLIGGGMTLMGVLLAQLLVQARDGAKAPGSRGGLSGE
jgi:drug/metabolite transporter (DMT)-like permease